MNLDLEFIALCAAALMAGLALAVGVYSALRSPRQARADSLAEMTRRAEAARAELAALLEHLEKVGSLVETKVDNQLGRLHDAIEHARQTIQTLQQLQSTAVEGGKRPLRLRGTLAQQVDELAGQGMDAVEIARRTQLDVGEVELLLSLRRSRQTRVEVD